MIFKIAWRNIWRNKRRSSIVLISVIIGLIAEILMDGITNGMMRQMLFNQINLNTAHIQIHNKGFKENKSVLNFIRDYKKVENVIKNNPDIQFYSPRIYANGMINGKNNSAGVVIYGIQPQKEANVSIIKQSVKEGNYLGERNNNLNPLLLGKKLSEKLNLKPGDMASLITTSETGEMQTTQFEIVGLFQTPSAQFDKSTIFTTRLAAMNLLRIKENYNEIAIIAADFKKITKIKEVLQGSLGNSYEISSYREMLPLLVYQMDIYQQLMIFLNVIIGIAWVFGIINIMLMAVFERIHEFGILMAIGMKAKKLFAMIVLEAMILGVFGAAIGLFFGMAIYLPLAHYGIDLSAFSSGLESFGAGAIIYPAISYANTFDTVLSMPVVAVIAALYPAYRAIKLEPVESINFV